MRFTVLRTVIYGGFYRHGDQQTCHTSRSWFRRGVGLLPPLFALVFLLLGHRVKLLGARCSRSDDSAANIAFEAVGLGYRPAGRQ